MDDVPKLLGVCSLADIRMQIISEIFFFTIVDSRLTFAGLFLSLHSCFFFPKSNNELKTSDRITICYNFCNFDIRNFNSKNFDQFFSSPKSETIQIDIPSSNKLGRTKILR